MDQQATQAWDEIPVEELRIAGVLNGGVSLAVWMGGAAHELNRLTRSDPDEPEGATPAGDYRSVLGLARTTAVVDVLAGTSAGGINGGALALAQVNETADLSVLRSLWAEQGRMENLLRKPFQGQPTSLLRGDDYFLPELARAMRSLVSTYKATGRHVDLVMPTTLLSGSTRETPDALGQLMLQSVFGGSFRFEFAPSEQDEATQQAALRDTAGAIALAARSSASFPFAFEATYIPVDDPNHRPDRDVRPDMQAYASWAKPGTNCSRYAVDGGVLANTPTRQALDAIDKRQAHGAVRRVMLLVYPHAPREIQETPGRHDGPPTVIGGAVDLFAALRSQGSLTFVEEIEEHNRRVSAWRSGRVDVLPASGKVEDLYDFVRAGWPSYVGLRRRLAAQSLAKLVAHAGWSYERVRQQAELAQTRPATGLDPNVMPQLPYVPPEPPPHTAALGTPTEWPWGTLVATGVADTAADVLRRALSVATKDEKEDLSAARTRVAELRDLISHVSTVIDEPWDREEARGLAPDLRYWRARLIAFRRAVRPDQPEDDRAALEQFLPDRGNVSLARLRDLIMARNGEQGAALGGAVREIAELLTKLVPTIRSIGSEPRGHAAGLDIWLPVLTDRRLDAEPEESQQRLLMRILALDTATWLVANAESAGTNLPINLVQLSLAVVHDWAAQSTSPDSKAAGMSLARFGGFLKRSWRMNDWTWGRLDAALLLCQVVLDPMRLRRIHTVLGGDPEVEAKRVLGRLGLMYGIPDDESEGVAEQPGYANALTELMSLFDLSLDTPPPSQLPYLAEFAARPLQWRIIIEELPFLAAAVVADNVDGQNERSRGNLFLQQNGPLIQDISDTRMVAAEWRELGARCLTAFDEAGIGREDLTAETGSDAIIQIAANAVGVGITLLDSSQLGIKAIKPFTRSVKGAALLPFWLITGLTRGGSMARALALAGFTLGGVLLALGLLGVLGGWSPAAAGIGGATVLSAFAYSALRTGSLLHGVVLLGAVVPLVAFVVDRRWSDSDARQAVVTVGVVSGVGIGLALLGSLPWPLASPFAELGALRDKLGSQWQRQRKHLVGVLVAIGTAVLAVAALTSPWARDQVWGRLTDSDRWPHWMSDHQLLTAWVAAAVVCIAGGAIAYQRGMGLRVWRRSVAGQASELARVTDPAGVAASWAAVYGAGYLVLALGLWQWIVDRGEPVCHLGRSAGDSTCTPVFTIASVLWLATLAAVLIALAPTLITWEHGRSLRRKLAGDPTLPRLHSDAELVGLLLQRDQAFKYLVKDPTGGLTVRGSRLRQVLEAARFTREQQAMSMTTRSAARSATP
jgi:patatin-related protein